MSPLFAFKVVCCDPRSCATWWPLDVWHNLELDKDKYEFHPTHANVGISMNFHHKKCDLDGHYVK